MEITLPHLKNYRYISAPFFMVRTAYWPIEVGQSLLEGDNWLEAVINFYRNDRVFQEAVAVASPSLYEALQKNQEVISEKVAGSLFNYALRMSSRAIPFGLFSFVGIGWWRDTTQCFFKLEGVQKKAKIDFSWLYSFIQEKYKRDLLHLPVRTNPLIQIRAGRAYLDFFRQAEGEEMQSKELSIRVTPLVIALFCLAQKGVCFSNLLENLHFEIPSIDLEKGKLVAMQLVEKQFLIPDKLPSLLNPDYSLGSFEQLSGIFRKVQEYSKVPVGGGVSQLKYIENEMKNHIVSRNYLQVNSYYEEQTISLPYLVREELEKSLDLLSKISFRKSVVMSLEDYHKKFLAKYGLKRTVALLELIDSEKGLGKPEKLSESSFELEKWDLWVHKKWEQCLIEGKNEISLSQEQIDYFFKSEKIPQIPDEELPLSLDLFFRIHANSGLAIDSGEFELHLDQTTLEAMSAFGRFIPLFDRKLDKPIEAFIKNEESLNRDSLFVELSYFPKRGHQANVMTHPTFRKYSIDLQDNTSLKLSDIYVGATMDRLYLTLKEGGKEIIVRSSNLLNIQASPFAFQFMRAVSMSRYRYLEPFHWGALNNKASFLPRIRCGKTILSPITWYADGCELLRKSKNETIKAFTAWANQRQVPRYISLVEKDQKLLIDRKHPANLLEIYRRIKKQERIKFTERVEIHWLKSQKGKHFCEFVASFVKNPDSVMSPTFQPKPYYSPSFEERVKLPGSEWFYIKLYLGQDGINHFVLSPLSDFINSLIKRGLIEGWFFIRYRDPDSHVRLRLRLADSQAVSKIIEALRVVSLKWLEQGQIRSLLIDSYERELERYGSLELMETAEVLFYVDSIEVLQLLNVVKNMKLKEEVVFPISVLEFLKGFSLSNEEITSLLGSISKSNAKGFREFKTEIRCLLENKEIKDLLFLASFEGRRLRHDFRKKMDKLNRQDFLGVVDDMLHMHCNRLGCDISFERTIRRYAFEIFQISFHYKGVNE